MDNTDFIRLSIHDVVVTLVEAIVLVVLVMYIFLQNWRATLMPAVAVPVVLLGTFGVLAAAGYSINTLTLFALVLVIGLLVDDAIVVVENVERIMREEGLPPREATLHSMKEITGALIGIGLVLTAVFLPMAFFGGSTGVIYRQFSVTIVSAMSLSIMVALVLTPALVRHPAQAESDGGMRMPAAWLASSPGSTAISSISATGTSGTSGHGSCSAAGLTMIAYAGIVAVLALLFCAAAHRLSARRGPGLRLQPDHICRPAPPSPARWQWPRTWRNITSTTKKRMWTSSSPSRASAFAGAGQNAGMAFIHLQELERAQGAHNNSAAIANRAMTHFFPDATMRRFSPSCRPRCRSWAMPPASIWSWKTAAISAMPA